MSYMRGEYYTWVGGNGINLPVEMPMEVFDELVMMRHAQMTDEEKEQAQQRALENHSGNVGCDALCEIYKQPTTLDIVKGMLEKSKKQPDK